MAAGTDVEDVVFNEYDVTKPLAVYKHAINFENLLDILIDMMKDNLNQRIKLVMVRSKIQLC